jgi:hypothetical protein
MKPVKNFLFAALLVSSMALPSFAGEIDTPGYTAPPPPPAKSTAVCSTDGDALALDSGSGTPVNSSETSDNLLYEALTVLYSIF